MHLGLGLLLISPVVGLRVPAYVAFEESSKSASGENWLRIACRVAGHPGKRLAVDASGFLFDREPNHPKCGLLDAFSYAVGGGLALLAAPTWSVRGSSGTLVVASVWQLVRSLS